METRSFSIRVLSAVAATTLAVVFAWSARGAQYVVQPGPAESKDIWTSSVYSFAPVSSYPGGGLNDETLRVGGWADEYYTLIQFNLSQAPGNATSAVLYLYCFTYNGGSGTPMYLDRITQAWDWRTQGTGRDRERLWWADRPAATQWIANTLPAPLLGQWYAVDITGLYNAWQSGIYPNYGLQLRPQLDWNNFNYFYSADYTNNVTLRPKLVIQAPAVAPTVTVPPQGGEVQVGGNFTFSVTAWGFPPLSYQWYFNTNTLLANATDATLTLTNLQHSNAGLYHVVVSNPFGSTNSSMAQLRVYDALVELQTQRYFGNYMCAGLNIHGQQGSTYVLKYTTDLKNTNFATWTPLRTNTMTGSSWFYLDTESPYSPYRFYGVKLLP